MILLLASMLVYLSNYHCATSSLDVLTSQQCKVVSTCSWRGSCGCLASRNGWWRYSQEDCGWLSKDQVILRALHLIYLPYEGIWLDQLEHWLDRLAWPIGWTGWLESSSCMHLQHTNLTFKHWSSCHLMPDIIDENSIHLVLHKCISSESHKFESFHANALVLD